MPVPDECRGETVKALVAVRPGETLTAEELVIAYAKERLAQTHLDLDGLFFSDNL